MSTATDIRLTPRQRLGRGLAHTASGPVDVTRAAIGLTAQSVGATARSLRRRYHASRLRTELEAAVEAVSELPQTLVEATTPDKNRRVRRLVIFGAAGAAVLAGGAVLFSRVRRARQPEPATLPPSVAVAPRP
jgi:cell wall synthesis protein CwsA